MQSPFAARTNENHRKCALVMPIVKSLAANGGWIQEGIAASERRDVQNEIVRLSDSPPWLLKYLVRCGSVDWNHGTKIIGKCIDGRWLRDSNEIRKSLDPMMHDTVLPAIWVKNSIHPLPKDRNMWHPDHLEFYRLAEAGHPLFMSAYGVGVEAGVGSNAVGESGNVVAPIVFNRIATTPEPMNLDAYGTITIAKSLSEFYREIEEGDHGVRNGVARSAGELPPLVFIAPNTFGDNGDLYHQIEKSLATTGAIPVEGTSGGDSLKTSGVVSFSNTAGSRGQCAKCKCSNQHPAARYCGQCGQSLYDAARSVAVLKKSIDSPTATLCCETPSAV